MSSKIDKVPPEIQRAFAVFCRTNGWSEAEILTLAMLRCIKEDVDIVVEVIRQRELRRKHKHWYTRLPFWPSESQLED